MSGTALPEAHVFVVLAYGESPFLAGCVGSLAAQTVKSRIVVATSTPTSHVRETAERAGVPLLVNPERRGIGADWNFGLTATSLRFVTLAHQDDVYRPDFLAATIAAFASHPEAALCFTGAQEVDDAGQPRATRVGWTKQALAAATLGRGKEVGGWRQRLFLSFGNPLTCSSVTYDRERLGDFRFCETLSSNLDWDAWWRLREAGHLFARDPRALVGRRSNALSETARLKRSGTRRREGAEMFRRIWPAPLGPTLAALYRAGY